MSKRSRRLGKKDELRAVEDAIGKALGKKTGGQDSLTAHEKGMAGKSGRRRGGVDGKP
jgi:ABC-type Fe3+-citrate transport system substrate-binding protein